VRANYHNRQAMRSARCFRARSPRDCKVPISKRGVVLTAYGHDLALLAATVADEIELSPDAINRLLGHGRPLAAVTN
jgi:hypothetical protein